MASFETRLLTRLKQLLREVDLASTTERQLRKSLEAEFDRELSGYKGLIRSCVEEYLQGADEQEEAEAPGGKEEEEEPVTEGGASEEKVPYGPLYVLSDEMAAFVGAPQLQRTQCLKKVWEYIKANGLNEGKDIHLDSVLSKLFDPPLSSPQIMKQLGKHLLEKIEGSALRTATKKRKATGPGNETGKKRASGYMKPVALTTELSALVGEEYMPRSQVVKSVWNYIKANDLQDPRNKKNIICDDRLRSLLGVDRFLGFSLMKYLNKHFLPA